MIIPGPSLPQRRGAQTYSSTSVPTGSVQTLVASGANTTGLFLRTAVLLTPSGGLLTIRSSAFPLFIAFSGSANLNHTGIILPPANSLELEANVAGCQAYLTWDIV